MSKNVASIQCQILTLHFDSNLVSHFNSDFDPKTVSDSNSDSDSDSDCNLVFMNLDIFIFFILYLHFAFF